MSSRDELAARRAAREAYATKAITEDHREHVDVGGTSADRAGPNAVEVDAAFSSRPEWANRR